MDNETIESFAKYRLNKAKETLETAEKIFKDVKLLITFGKKLWTGAAMLARTLHLKEFAINKAMALKKWTLDTIHHAAQMATTAKENVMNTAVHSSRIGAVLKEMAMSVLEHTSKMFNIAKDFVMSVIRHTADMARIAYALACELAKFIKDMIVTGIKLIQAIALFIADMARVVFQIAMTAAQYLLIAAAVIAIVALVGLIIYGLIKVISMIAPMIADFITTFLSAAWEIIKNIAGTLVEFLAPVGKAVIDFLMALNPVYLIIKLITGIAGAIKDFFKSDKKEAEAEEPVSEEAASALGITADVYNNIEQQKMNLFDSKMNAVLKQIKDLGKVIMLSAAATMVTAKFFGVNPQNGQAAPQGTSMFAQTVATDGSTASESVEKENTSNDYNNVLEQMIKLLQEIRDKKVEVDTKKKKEFFNIF